MPLTRSSIRFRAGFDGVYFRMKDAGKNVTCIVSHEALDNHFRGTPTRQGRVSIFKENRLLIERAASAKYDKQGVDGDGSVRVGTGDLKPDRFAATAA
jgi:hypothetical protein